MPDEELDNNDQGSTPPTQTGNAPASNNDEVAKLHQENAKWRTQLRDAEKRLKDLEKSLADTQAANEAIKQKELVEQGRWKDIAEQNALKLAQLENLPNQLKQYEETIQSLLTGQTEGLPAAIIELLAKMNPLEQLAWLSKHKSEIIKPPEPQKPSLTNFNPSGQGQGAESDRQRLERIQKQRGQMLSPFANQK